MSFRLLAHATMKGETSSAQSVMERYLGDQDDRTRRGLVLLAEPICVGGLDVRCLGVAADVVGGVLGSALDVLRGGAAFVGYGLSGVLGC